MAMTSQQRTKASVDLTLTYLQNYYPDWRLAKVLTIQKILAERYEFYKDIIEEVKSQPDGNGEATIAQEIRNGLYFDAISQCVQYVEDLFALINAGTKPDYFIKNIITYNAGKVTSLIKAFNANLSTKKISEAFHFQNELPFTSDDDKKTYDQHVEYLLSLAKDVVKFYKDYEYFHNQYKHGLAVAMRPFGNTYVQEQIDQDKQGTFEPYIAVYDNRELSIAAKMGTFRAKDGAIMVGFTENVRPFIGDLAKENNFIRLVHPEDSKLDINLLVDVAYKTRACINTFLSNYTSKINADKNELKFQLPVDYRTHNSLIVSYRNE
jgi:hypothetical protein